MDVPPLWPATRLALRAALGAGVALALATWFGLEHPLYAFLAAVIVTDLSPATTRQLGWRRFIATIVGASCGAVLSLVLPPNPLGIGVGVFTAMLLCALVRMQEGAKVGGYICGIVILTHSGDAWSYAAYRFIETVIGIAVAWAISLVPHLPARDSAGPSARRADPPPTREGAAP